AADGTELQRADAFDRDAAVAAADEPRLPPGDVPPTGGTSGGGSGRGVRTAGRAGLAVALCPQSGGSGTRVGRRVPEGTVGLLRDCPEGGAAASGAGREAASAAASAEDPRSGDLVPDASQCQRVFVRRLNDPYSIWRFRPAR